MQASLDPVLGAVLPVFGLVACGDLAGTAVPLLTVSLVMTLLASR